MAWSEKYATQPEILPGAAPAIVGLPARVSLSEKFTMQ